MWSNHPGNAGWVVFPLLPRTISGILSQTRAAIVALLGATMLAGTPDGAFSQAREVVSPAERCLAANQGLSLGVLLPRTAARLKSSEPLKIVAIGSSSTVGLWVLASAATYLEVCAGNS
jgi:acyl-CoA thioesterase-1